MWGCLAGSLDDSAEEAKPTLGPRWRLGTAVYTECSCHSYFLLRGATEGKDSDWNQPKDVTPHSQSPWVRLWDFAE